MKNSLGFVFPGEKIEIVETGLLFSQSHGKETNKPEGKVKRQMATVLAVLGAIFSLNLARDR